MRAAIVALCALAACDDGGERFAPAPVESSNAAAPSASAPKKPPRIYYLVNEAKKCEVFWLEDGQRSIKKSRPCPRDVAEGEKIRLTGKNCIRESLEPARNIPVRCPRELYKAAEADQHGGGPDRLAPAASSSASL
jgi:hypothetical protein